MGKFSRSKGKRGEREAAKFLNDLLKTNCRRGVQFQGSPDSPDVVGLEGIHVEVKRVEKLNLYDAVEQAVGDSGENIPMVLHRRNNKDWLAVVKAEDLIQFAKQIISIALEEGEENNGQDSGKDIN